MIISKTPIRLTLFGGGTDYPIFFNKYGGETLSFAINKYSYILVKENNYYTDYKYFLSYKNIEKIDKISDIDHPSIRETLNYLKINRALEIHYTGDIPAKTGLGSSSSFTVGLLKSLYGLNKKKINNLEIAKKAIFIEQNLIKENVGCQDQFTTALGGVLNIKYNKNRFLINKIKLTKDDTHQLEKSIILFFTGIERNSSKSLRQQIKKTSLGKNTQNLIEIKNQVFEAKNIMKNNIDIKLLGELLNENWEIKKKLSENITNSSINEIYMQALSCGIYGGKLVGAGAGGFLMFLCSESVKTKLKKKFYKLKYIEIKIEYNGSRIIL